MRTLPGVAVAGLAVSLAFTAEPEATPSVSVTGFRLPSLAWNTNTLELDVHNASARAQSVTVRVQYESLIGAGEVAWDSEHVLEPGEETRIDRDFMVKPIPGQVAIRVTVSLASADPEAATIFAAETRGFFPVSNGRINPLRATPRHDGSDYPRLVRVEADPFVFYYPQGDAYAEANVEGLGRKRREAYHRLVEKIRPGFDRQIAFLLFPDADTKWAYTFHRGEGWAVGNVVIAEIYNDTSELDPNHELAHIVAASVGRPPALFDEGLATYLQEGESWLGHPIDAWAETLKRKGVLLRLQRLFGFAEIGSPETCGLVAYPQSASVVKFLIRESGWPAFLRAFAELESSAEEATIESNLETFEEVFGAPLAEVEGRWLASIDQAKAAVISDADLPEIVCEQEPRP